MHSDEQVGATTAAGIDRGELRQAICVEYETVAREPNRGFHFYTGRRLAHILGYEEDWLKGIPESSIESFAGTGNPFSLGAIRLGERVVDVGCGAGIDSLIAAGQTGPEGRVFGIDMTEAMLQKARGASVEAGLGNVEFRFGHAEDLPVEDHWADVVISNGVLNLTPDKHCRVHDLFSRLPDRRELQRGCCPMGNHIWRLPNGHRLVHLAPKEIGADLPLEAVNESVDFLI
jgi:arsenite methyltransferase